MNSLFYCSSSPIEFYYCVLEAVKRLLFYTVGISGSGKSWYYKNVFLKDFKDVSDFLVEKGLSLEDIKVCPDDIRREVTGDVSDMSKDGYVWKLAETRVKEKLDEYGYALFDATGTSRKARKFLKKFKAEKIALVFKPDAKLSISRIKNDINEGVDRSNVPPVAVYAQLKAYKASVIEDVDWNGVWNRFIKKKIIENLKNEFDEVVIV